MKRFILSTLCILTASIAFSQNPFIRHMYTADLSGRVFNDTLYVYPSHDQDTATGFSMEDWHVFSTTDMVNWKDNGVAFSLKNTSWAKAMAWAPDCAKGKWYMFYHNSDLYYENHPDLEQKFGWGHMGSLHPFRRSICVDELHYRKDGTIEEVIPTKKGVKKVK